MNRDDILNKLKDVLEEVLDISCDSITEDSVRQDIEEWDSLAHINVVMELEKELGIKFSLEEINKMIDVKRIIDIVSEKTL